jgi:predicted solute-binding protein
LTGLTVSLIVLISHKLESSPAFHSAFKEECSALCLVNGDAALAASDYDKAIDLYSAAIDLNSASYAVFVKRSKTKSEKILWDDALLDAQKVR